MFCFYQEPDSKAGDLPNSAVSEPDPEAPLPCASTEDEITDEQEAPSVPDVPIIASSTDSLPQLPVEEKSITQSTDTSKPEPVFASASVKPRLEVKNDLSSMFKSLSAKMKRERQSRFSDISTEVSSGLLPSSADPITSVEGRSPGITSEANHLLLTLTDWGTSSTNEDTVCGDTTSVSLQSFGHYAAPSRPLDVSNQSGALTFNMQNYDMTSNNSPLSSDRVSSLPMISQASTPHNNMIAVTYSVTGVMSSRLGL